MRILYRDSGMVVIDKALRDMTPSERISIAKGWHFRPLVTQETSDGIIYRKFWNICSMYGKMAQSKGPKDHGKD